MKKKESTGIGNKGKYMIIKVRGEEEYRKIREEKGEEKEYRLRLVEELEKKEGELEEELCKRYLREYLEFGETEESEEEEILREYIRPMLYRGKIYRVDEFEEKGEKLITKEKTEKKEISEREYIEREIGRKRGVKIVDKER